MKLSTKRRIFGHIHTPYEKIKFLLPSQFLLITGYIKVNHRVLGVSFYVSLKGRYIIYVILATRKAHGWHFS